MPPSTITSFLLLAVSATATTFEYTVNHKLSSLCWDGSSADATTVFSGIECPTDSSKIKWESMKTVDDQGQTVTCLNGWTASWSRQPSSLWNAAFLGEPCGVSPTQYSLPIEAGQTLEEFSHTVEHTISALCFGQKPGATASTVFYGTSCPDDPSSIIWNRMETVDDNGDQYCQWNRKADHENFNSWNEEWLGSCGTAPNQVQLPTDTLSFDNVGDGICEDSAGNPYRFYELEYPNSDRSAFCSSIDQGPAPHGMTLPNWYLDHTNGGSGQWGNCEALCRADSQCRSWMGRNSGNTCYLSTATELVPCPSGTDCSDHHPHTFNALNCGRENYCSSTDQGPAMSLPNWYMDHTNGGSGQWGNCEALCRADSQCNSWMGRNSGNTCYLSTATALVSCPWGDCSDHHPHTLNAANCGSSLTNWSTDENFCGKKCLHDSKFHQASFTGVEVEPVVDFAAMTVEAECRCLFDYTLHTNAGALSSTGSGTGMVIGSTGSISGAENSVCYREINF